MIGENIAILRKKKNLTQEELANLINVSPKTISAYETNRSLPNIEVLMSLSKVLDTNIDTILGIDKNETQEISQTYEKFNFKENIFKIIFMALIFIIPIIFFYWAGYVSLTSLMAHYYAFGSIEVSTTIDILNSFVIEYVIYLALMLINYILYQKKCQKTLLVINIVILIVFLIDFISSGFNFYVDYLIFIFSSIIGLIWSYMIYSKNN